MFIQGVTFPFFATQPHSRHMLEMSTDVLVDTGMFRGFEMDGSGITISSTEPVNEGERASFPREICRDARSSEDIVLNKSKKRVILRGVSYSHLLIVCSCLSSIPNVDIHSIARTEGPSINRAE